MSNGIDEIDLSSYSIDELAALVVRVQEEVAHKKQAKLREIRGEMERLAGSAGISLSEIVKLDGKKAKNAKPAGTIKYQSLTDSSQTWSGRGKRPRWLHQALLQGAKLEDLLVQK